MITKVTHFGSALLFCSNEAHRTPIISPDILVKSKNLIRLPSYFFLGRGDLMAYTNIEYGSPGMSLVSTNILHHSIPGILFKNRYRHGAYISLIAIGFNLLGLGL